MMEMGRVIMWKVVVKVNIKLKKEREQQANPPTIIVLRIVGVIF